MALLSSSGRRPETPSNVPSGYGEYDQLFAANPYRNVEYNETFWQKAASALGLRTGADKYRESAAVNAAEYDANIFSLIQQNEYNSEVAKAERMRLAGENPDLLGTGSVADAASNQPDPNGMVEPDDGSSEFNPFKVVESVARDAFSAVQMTIGLFKDFSSLHNVILNNEASQLGNASSMMDLARRAILEGLGDTPPSDFQRSNFSAVVDRLGASFFPSRKQRDKFSAVATEMMNSLPTEVEAYKKWRENAQNRKGYYKDTAHSRGYGDVQFMQDFFEFTEGLAQAAENAQNTLVATQSKEEIEYLGAHDATAEATRDNEQYATDTEVARYQRAQTTMTDQINEQFRVWTDKLKRAADSGDTFASIGLAIIGVLRLMINSNLHYSGNSSSSHNLRQGASSESSGFSFGF